MLELFVIPLPGQAGQQGQPGDLGRTQNRDDPRSAQILVRGKCVGRSLHGAGGSHELTHTGLAVGTLQEQGSEGCMGAIEGAG